MVLLLIIKGDLMLFGVVFFLGVIRRTYSSLHQFSDGHLDPFRIC